jgi:hypothetical protein
MTRWPYEAVGKTVFGRGLIRTQERTARGIRLNLKSSGLKPHSLQPKSASSLTSNPKSYILYPKLCRAHNPRTTLNP